MTRKRLIKCLRRFHRGPFKSTSLIPMLSVECQCLCPDNVQCLDTIQCLDNLQCLDNVQRLDDIHVSIMSVSENTDHSGPESKKRSHGEVFSRNDILRRMEEDRERVSHLPSNRLPITISPRSRLRLITSISDYENGYGSYPFHRLYLNPFPTRKYRKEARTRPPQVRVHSHPPVLPPSNPEKVPWVKYQFRVYQA